jgi:hypothetical protein
MGTVIMAAGALFALMAAVCGIIILINAFKQSTGTGILSLLFFPYALYFAFAKFTHQKKGLILAGWLGGIFLSCALSAAGAAMSAAAALPG